MKSHKYMGAILTRAMVKVEVSPDKSERQVFYRLVYDTEFERGTTVAMQFYFMFRPDGTMFFQRMRGTDASSINGLLPTIEQQEKNNSNTSMGKYILFLLLSTFWVTYEGIPYVPLGFILVIFWVRVKSLKYYIPFLLALIMGFVGTGGYLAFFTEQRTMIKTGETHDIHKFNFGLRFGTTTLDNLRNRGKVIIYKDKRVANQVAKATKVMEQFVESYNKNSIDFLMKYFANLPNIDEPKIKEFIAEMRSTHGDIEIFSYMGDVTYKQQQPVFAVFYKIKTQKDKSRVIRLLFNVSDDRASISFIKVGFIPKDIEFRVIEI